MRLLMRYSVIYWILFQLVLLNLKAQEKVEKWDFFELPIQAETTKNPYTEIDLKARFYNQSDTINVDGFYDGDNLYKIRFMPSGEGEWNYNTISSHEKLNNRTGSFICISPAGNNKGPVRVHDTFHFSYADNSPFYPLGTTAYGWVQRDSLTRSHTLKSLKESPFNKVRFMILPHAPSGKECELYPYARAEEGWDFSRFNPAYFQRYDSCIKALGDLGIQADMILFHPYDRGTWGFDQMDKEEQYLYLKYVNARYGAFHNVWWSMANEFDLMTDRTMEDWDGYFQFFVKNDPYQHLRSNHNAGIWYDHREDWVTHASLQTESWWMAKELRLKYGKPVIFDEFCYEGDGINRTVALNGDVLTHRMWLITIVGAYGTHGEGLFQPRTAYQFFRQGGEFAGSSVHELHVLKQILNEVPGHLEPMGNDWRLNRILAGIAGQFYLYYLGEYQNALWHFTELPENTHFSAKVIDTRTGEIYSTHEGIKKGDRLDLPGKPYMAIVLKRANSH